MCCRSLRSQCWCCSSRSSTPFSSPYRDVSPDGVRRKAGATIHPIVSLRSVCRSAALSLPVILATQMLAFFAVGVYRGVWRHFGMMDTLVIARGVFFGAGSALLVILGVYRFFAYSRTVFAIYAVLLLIAVTLSRASFRLVAEFMRRQRDSGRRIVIYGAGDAAGLVMREVLSSGQDVRIIGFVDDDPRKGGGRVGGYP